MTRVLRGQQGFPTGDGRPPAGPADRDTVQQLPGPGDWQHPEQAEAAVEAARDALAESNGRPAEGTPSESTELIEEAERIEDEVAPGRGGEGDEPPTERSAND